MMRLQALCALAAVAGAGISGSGGAQVPGRAEPPPAVFDSHQMFALAEAAERRGDVAVAQAAYRALTRDPLMAIRNEARFRLAAREARGGRHAAAASLLRQILDEQPDAQRVRLELARMLDLMGDENGARRLLREARAGRLPPEVVRLVDRYSAALRARKPFGGSIDFAIAPDSNINRATRDETLGTVIGDFILDDAARQRSGIGVQLTGHGYGRLHLSGSVGLLTRLSGAADLYRKRDFNSMTIGLSAGPEFTVRKDRLAIEAGVRRRWLGGQALISHVSVGASLLHPLDGTSQLRMTASAGRITHHFNRLQSGRSYALSVGYERALSVVSGLGATLAFERQSLRDPGYSSSGAQAALFAYREIGPVTLVGSIGHGRFAADRRLFLYAKRRKDQLYRASLGATFRQLAVGGLAPFIRATYEKNRSSVGIFEFRRTRAEVGISRAF